jgi:hypothetical protein
MGQPKRDAQDCPLGHVHAVHGAIVLCAKAREISSKVLPATPEAREVSKQAPTTALKAPVGGRSAWQLTRDADTKGAATEERRGPYDALQICRRRGTMNQTTAATAECIAILEAV